LAEVIKALRAHGAVAWCERMNSGAARIGFLQSLRTTCKLRDYAPYTYLADVLHRVSEKRSIRGAEPTPRRWKGRFAGSPTRVARHEVEGRLDCVS
jgi:hypothetical protein